MKVVIRLMVNEDKPAIVDLLRTVPEFTPDEVTVAEEVLDAYLRDPSGSGYYVFVAEAEAKVVGYVCYGPTPLTKGTWDIYWLVVDPKRQGQGIGSALMAFAEAKIKDNKGRLIIVETSGRPDYEKTRRFYKSHDYSMVAKITSFYAPGDDKLILEKRLE